MIAALLEELNIVLNITANESVEIDRPKYAINIGRKLLFNYSYAFRKFAIPAACIIAIKSLKT